MIESIFIIDVLLPLNAIAVPPDSKIQCEALSVYLCIKVPPDVVVSVFPSPQSIVSSDEQVKYNLTYSPLL